MQPRLSSNSLCIPADFESWQPSCLSLLSIGISGMNHHAQDFLFFLRQHLDFKPRLVMLSSSCPHPNKMPFGYCYSNELKSQKERVQSKGSKPAFFFQKSQLFSPRVLEFPQRFPTLVGMLALAQNPSSDVSGLEPTEESVHHLWLPGFHGNDTQKSL